MNRKLTPRLILILLIVHLAACSSMQPVSIENAVHNGPAGVDIGSLVEIRTLDGRQVKFRVTDITPDGLGGQMGHFAWSNMESLKVEKPGSGSDETLAWVIGIVGVAALVALVANADSVAVCGGTGCPAPGE